MSQNPAFPVEAFKWFDIKALTPEDGVIPSMFIDEMRLKMPFDRNAIVTKDTNGNRLLLLTGKTNFPDGEGVFIKPWIEYASDKRSVPIFGTVFVVVNQDGQDAIHTMQIDDKNNPVHSDQIQENEKQCIDLSIAFFALFLNALEKRALDYHEPQRRSNHAKRIRHGKKPFFDWRTVTIQPTKPAQEPLGGTHASPRQHERRGHWRVIKKTSKKVWVKNCTVGNAINGVVFHDYKIKGE